ncbi:helix-turn-helix domain-containing protein [uncultured Paludibaculum sp.]|uniref:helix-turn-helix domain-containing protein n=1 Tax=uncultured Paludibaculum sp. TaxID=1765020 RepID=UPI002AAB6FA0|nr:helix-turn-helix domain-containing protein [uncultured Paludibaculum sp.]
MTLPAAGAETITAALQDEIRRSKESRYDHRLHGVLLVAEGMSCRQAAAILGDSPRAVEYWVRNFERNGLAGLRDGSRPGRPPRLTDDQMKLIGRALRRPPHSSGRSVGAWDGKVLSEFVKKELGVVLGIRQCQRLVKSLGPNLKPAGSVLVQDDDERRVSSGRALHDQRRPAQGVSPRKMTNT